MKCLPIITLDGPAGVGKSTLAKHMNAILLPSGGKVYVDGIDTVDEDRLLDIRDNYPKFVLRTDDFAGGNYEGIQTMHVADFLLSDMF